MRILPFLFLPIFFDWRLTNFLSPLRNQHQIVYNNTLCGICWAMASTSTISDRYNIHKNKNSLSSFLSVQHVLDCNPYEDSCDGGKENHVYKYAKHYGIPPETCNIYKGFPSSCKTCYQCNYRGECKEITAPKLIYIKSYHIIPPKDINLIKEEIYKRGPITCSIRATKNLEKYKEGIYSEFFKEPIKLNHVISVVGWGQDYWIIRNSWGIAWGEKGFGRITMQEEHDLGITEYCSYPTI